MSGARLHHGAQRLLRTVEVRDQHLDAHERRAAADLPDRGGEGAGPAVRQVVAGNAGDHDVVQAHGGNGLSDTARLVVVEPRGLAGLNGTEPAGPRADVARDHHRRHALVPALPDVWADGLGAHRVEVQARDVATEVVVVVARRHAGVDPVGVPAEGPRPELARSLDTERLADAYRDRDRRCVRVGVGGIGVEDGEFAGHAGASPTVADLARPAKRRTWSRGTRRGPICRPLGRGRIPCSRRRAPARWRGGRRWLPRLRTRGLRQPS